MFQFWILLQLRMIEVVVTTGAIRHAKAQVKMSSPKTNTQFFYRPDALPVAQPTRWIMAGKAFGQIAHVPARSPNCENIQESGQHYTALFTACKCFSILKVNNNEQFKLTILTTKLGPNSVFKTQLKTLHFLLLNYTKFRRQRSNAITG